MRQITVSDKVFFALREVGPAVGHDVKAVGEVGDVTVHMVGQKDAFFAGRAPACLCEKGSSSSTNRVGLRRIR